MTRSPSIHGDRVFPWHGFLTRAWRRFCNGLNLERWFFPKQPRPAKKRPSTTGWKPVPQKFRLLLLCSHLVPLLCLLVLASASPQFDSRTATESSPQFSWVDVYIDPKGQPLAAYQFELTAHRPGVTLVGVEGGEHPAYAEPPYYDPRANLQNRIVIAAFNTGDNLPKQKTRIARVMIRTTGSPDFAARLDVAASIDAKPIAADIQVSEGAAP